jgi:hypothetical protein
VSAIKILSPLEKYDGTPERFQL